MYGSGSCTADSVPTLVWIKQLHVENESFVDIHTSLEGEEASSALPILSTDRTPPGPWCRWEC